MIISFGEFLFEFDKMRGEMRHSKSLEDLERDIINIKFIAAKRDEMYPLKQLRTIK